MLWVNITYSESRHKETTSRLVVFPLQHLSSISQASFPHGPLLTFVDRIPLFMQQ